MFFSCLDPPDLLSYSQICRDAYMQVQSYWARALDIYRLLSPFFTRGEAQQFRIIQALTGTLISGSSALQFLSRTSYPGSDLDTYVEHRYCKPVALYLQSIGYEFQPLSHQPAELDAAIALGSANVNANYIGQRNPTDESKGGFGGVYNMTRGPQKIQLITAKESPLDIILRFHSTVVMNVISYSHAYSLYPKATFRGPGRSYSMICDISHYAPATLLALQKYTERGWPMIDFGGHEWEVYVVEGTTGRLELQMTGECLVDPVDLFQSDKSRYLGDPYCWKYKLREIPVFPPAVRPSSAPLFWQESDGYDFSTPLTWREAGNPCGPQALDSNCWVLGRSESRDGFGEMKYKIFRDSLLRFAYCVPSGGLIMELKVPKHWKGLESDLESWGDADSCNFQADSDDLLYREVVKHHMDMMRVVGDYIRKNKLQIADLM
ncbi:hypothetical protein V5O48_014349 [Marasmius crinis-equi]|uniref:Uncharacterized protein n=1 Tax=Marasmius crinis-equi TaxID=585013 RepID=A0ABR3EXJ3_9AGAR